MQSFIPITYQKNATHEIYKNQKHKYQFRKHSAQKKNTIFCNFKIGDKEYVLEHNKDENIEIEISFLLDFLADDKITKTLIKKGMEKRARKWRQTHFVGSKSA